MLKTESICSFYISKSRNKSYVEFLKDLFKDQNLYKLQYSKDVFRFSEDMSNLMLLHFDKEIENFYFKNLSELKISTKENIKNEWELPLPYFKIKTSGTTGHPFSYKVWNECFYSIEIVNHYCQILNEFSLNNEISVLKVSSKEKHFVSDQFEKIIFNKCVFYVKKFKPIAKNYRFSHGSEYAFCHYFVYDKKDIIEFCNFIINYTKKEKIDVFISAFSFFSILLSCIDKPTKICNLLSNTVEEPIFKDVNFALENQIIENFCNHMRSWDGGATFITCKYGNLHLLDYLTYCEEVEGKLVSTDFLNISTPFFRYWNGDLCRINNCQLQCSCGRYYRKFEFNGRKSFIWQNIPSVDIFDCLSIISCFSQAKCYNDYIEISTTLEIDIVKKEILRKQLGNVVFSKNNFMFGRYDKIDRIVNLQEK